MGEKTEILDLTDPLDSQEYRGCGIRAVSYKTRTNEWVPDACFWLRTRYGVRRLWVASFAHCFARPGLTFADKLGADDWAFRLARELIDRTLPEFTDATAKPPVKQKSYIAKVIRIVSGRPQPFTS
jgi:hypothetical protein